MRQFNAPPGWPEPPNARWRPPKRWRPDESWPPAPADWSFWIDEHRHPVRGPFGRFGGPSLLRYGGAAAILIALIVMVLVNPFSGGDSDQASGPSVRETATVPGTSEPTATESPTDTPSATPSSTKPRTTPTPVMTRETIPTPTPETPETPISPKPTTSRPSEAPTTQAAVTFQNCAEARAAGKAPLREGDPGYSRELDRNGDGTACERGNS